jgi:NAD(P)-dependent dehydrogenase (short-subunit alcohol dehydrogenase family)
VSAAGARGPLAGRHVVVVGGASGIGRAVALGALARGARASAIDVDRAGLDALRAEAPAVAAFAADVRDGPALGRAFEALGAVDHVYVAAGTTRPGGLLDGPLDAQLEPLVVRLWGGAHVARAAATRLPPGGSLTFTGGVSTDRPVPGAWVSSVGTAAAEQFARAMALELAPVRCNAVAPGWTDTPLWDAVLGPAKAETFAAVAAKLPTRALARPEQVADAVLFLMGNEAITGEVVHVDGGGRLV